MTAMLMIKVNTNSVPDAPGRWLRGEIVTVLEDTHILGSGESNTNNFFRFTVTDKTVAEMQEFIASWNRLIDMNVFQGPDGNGLRSIRVRNNLVNASGDMGEWTVANTDAINLEWNTQHPSAGLITLDIPSPDVWECEGTFTTGEAQEFEDTIIQAGLSDLLKRRIWYITEAGMVNIDAAGGVQSGTASQLAPVLRDGLLD